jgi:hypothetical protein
LAFVFAAGGALVATPVMGLSGKRAWISLREALNVKPAFYLIKTFFSFVFFTPKKKQIRWEAGRGLSFFT